jgi:hypothetical protein
MTRIVQLLAQKQSELQQAQEELQALRVAAHLLDEHAEYHLPRDAGTIAASPTRRFPGAFPGDDPPLCTSDDDFIFAERSTGVVAAIAATATAITDQRTFAGAGVRGPLTPTSQKFPQPKDGFLICDVCGHRNPETAIDCERCDIPLRQR